MITVPKPTSAIDISMSILAILTMVPISLELLNHHNTIYDNSHVKQP